MAKGKRVKKSKKNNKAAVIIASAAALVIVAAFLLLGVYVSGRKTVFPNITVSGIDVGGLSYDRAHSTLLNSGIGMSNGVTASVTLTDDVVLTVTSEDAGIASSVTGAADAAYAYGREGNFVTNVFTFISCVFSEHDIMSETVFDEDNVRTMVQEAAESVNRGAIEPGYEVGDTEIIVTKGASGYEVDQDGVFQYIKTTLLSGVSGETDEFSEVKTSGENGGGIDFTAIYDEIYVEPKNAEYDQETQGATEAVTGVSFDLGAAERAYEAAAPGDTISIELIITEPEITSEQLEGYLFRDLLTSKMTTMYTSSSNRINNITLAAAAINGTVLNPGEEFSFNGIVGERTEAKGYKPAGAYVGGESVDQIGGGICQVSSTIYYCVLKANLEVVSRSNHMYSVAYLPLGFDATVNWGTIDFKFKNNQDYPIKVVAYVQNKELYVELWGTKLDDSYVELQYNLIETLDFDTIEKEDETLAPGETKVKTAGHSGYIVEAYQLLYDGDGNLISKTFLSRDTYRKQDRVILVGPAEEPDPGTTEPDPGTTEPVEPDPEPTEPDPGTTEPTDPDPGTTEPVEPGSDGGAERTSSAEHGE
ncbi:MAG: VanW family protein [Oscillospiraceae bacterium]